MPNGTERKVLIINKRNAKVQVQNLPSEDVKLLSTDSEASNGNITVKQNATVGKRIRYEAVFIFREQNENVKEQEVQALSNSETENTSTALTFDALGTSEDGDEDDAEIWFIIKLNDADGDGIPFYKELELNKELEKRGYSRRFDPRKNDAYGDYDGDGVPNSVELFIGKDPAKRDILGIELNISVEWTMSEDDKKNLIYSIRKASDFIYDYTDGYAMITKINVWDGKRNIKRADVWVNETFLEVKFIGDNKKWPQATIGGYWTGGKLVMPYRFLRPTPPVGIAELGDVQWARALGHELGHYVFWLGDEYEDWKGRTYYWNYGLDGPDVDTHAPHSVMHHEWKWSELSTPRDYENFKQYLTNKYGDWKPYITDQWGNVTKNPMTDYPIWHCSAWEALFKSLTGHGRPEWTKGPYTNICMDLNFDGTCDRTFPQEYIPKTGPYTGVGYFMGVNLK